MKYDAEVAAAVAQTQRLYGLAVDPALVQAVIQRETSHGSYPMDGTLEPNQHRSYGPMQVEDSTAAQHGIADPSSLSIPSVGIRIGTFELARLLKMFPGDTARAVAAYNAGPGNAQRNPNTQRFVNQPYVDAVLSFWARYRTPITQAAGIALPVILGLVLLFFVARRRRSAPA